MALQLGRAKLNGASFHTIELAGGSLGAAPVNKVRDEVRTMVVDTVELQLAHCSGDSRARVGPRANQLCSYAHEGAR